jgi:hypothetical protein
MWLNIHVDLVEKSLANSGKLKENLRREWSSPAMRMVGMMAAQVSASVSERKVLISKASFCVLMAACCDRRIIYCSISKILTGRIVGTQS